ncbi:MAG: NAD(P)/FAD-dependent oxidoreductase [Microthrixaceae bacterium]
MTTDLRSHFQNLLQPTSHAESSTAAGKARSAEMRRLIAEGAPTPRIAILGAGAAGICMAIQLLEQGIDSFTLFEKGTGVGGTWRDNTYPGAACDVPSHLYSFSFAPKVDWSRKFPNQPEILEYLESLVTQYNLTRHLRFSTEVTTAVWNEERCVWVLELNSGETHEAEVVVSGLGQLNRPNIPQIPGLDSFTGTKFHSARWDHDHELQGERVAVVGIGASAIQFVPRVAKVAQEITLFQRSVNYVAPKPDRPFTPRQKWALQHIPGLRQAYRSSIYWRLEFRFRIMKKGSKLGAMLQKKFGEEVSKMASPKLPAEAIVPEYTPGCRRILISNDWYPTLLQPQTRVVTDGIAQITESSIVTQAGEEIPVDTIIFGTGFQSTEFLAPMKITGREGIELNNAWREGARAFLGLAVAGFPNFFILYGPNTNLGHNSILFMIEQQVGYIRKIIDEFVAKGVTSIEVRERSMDNFDSEITTAVSQTVWSEDCSSWYKNAQGRVTNNWPDYTVAYKRRLARPDQRDWKTSTSHRVANSQ